MSDLPLSRRRFLTVAAASAGLAACAQPASPPPTFAPIRFKGRPAFRLNVERVEIINRYQAPGRLPNIEHILANSPVSVATAWAEDRLEAGGQPGGAIAQFIISDGHIIESELPKTEGLKGVFTRDQAFKYDARLAVELVIRNERGMTDGSVGFEIRPTNSVKEDATEAERLTLWNEMVALMGRELAANMDSRVPQGLAKYMLF